MTWRRWRLRCAMITTAALLPAILPSGCSETLLRGLTPFLIDGSSALMRDVLFFAAPYVLP